MRGSPLYEIGTLLWLQVLSDTDSFQQYPFVGVGSTTHRRIRIPSFTETIMTLRACDTILVIIGIHFIACS